LAFCLFVVASGCVLQPSKPGQVVWLASTDNGDKPGNGIKLVENAGHLKATFFLLDPNKPHDFKTGRAFPTETVQSNETQIRLVVHLDENKKDEIVVEFQRPLKGKRVNATLRNVRDEGQPVALTFIRQN
jgi:hypothetical protein